MLVVTFDVDGAGNCVVAGDDPYVWASTADGPFVLSARCAHRGGPMHLARLDTASNCLVCPWHGRLARVRRQREGGPPAARRGGRVTAVLPHDPRTPWRTEYRPIGPALRHTGPGATRRDGR